MKHLQELLATHNMKGKHIQELQAAVERDYPEYEICKTTSIQFAGNEYALVLLTRERDGDAKMLVTQYDPEDLDGDGNKLDITLLR